jgi:hypothetical protein
MSDRQRALIKVLLSRLTEIDDWTDLISALMPTLAKDQDFLWELLNERLRAICSLRLSEGLDPCDELKRILQRSGLSLSAANSSSGTDN